MDDEEPKSEVAAFVPRGYQLEMLEASLERNIIVAMDTGSGKTPIAVLRIAAELERCASSKRVWFLCPKVALAQQQARVIQRQLPAAICKVLVGDDGCEYWSGQAIWDMVLLNVHVVVCTPGILYDALMHGFVGMADIALLIFDEAHYCKDNHPANRILTSFYHPARIKGDEVPYILGLTASPVFGNKLSGLETIESNLNSICRTPRLNREELLRYTHRPILIQQSYDNVESLKPRMLQDLESKFHSLSIFDDPWIKHLQANQETTEKHLREVLLKGKTNCREQLKTLIRATNNVLIELGPWASEWYLIYCINSFQKRSVEEMFYIDSVDQSESDYLLVFFKQLDLVEEYQDFPNTQNVSSKVNVLVDLLLQELQYLEVAEDDEVERARTSLTGIVFVETRIVVCVLKQLLQHHPLVKPLLRLGLSFGTSTNTNRKSMICDCVMRDKSIEDIEVVLDDLRFGVKNLLISTNVVEEGIDITACNRIICFDPPKNLVSFVQRRGRARDEKSKYFIMFPKSQVATGVSKWHQLEVEMIEKYMDHMREIQALEESETLQVGTRIYQVESTGARMDLKDALPHLHHFCNTLGDVRYASSKPVYSFDTHMVDGTVMCKIVLPGYVDSTRRFQSSEYWPSETLAKADAAFEACIALHKEGLLNDNFLPIKHLSEGEASMYQIIEKRPNIVEVSSEYNPWPSIAKLSSDLNCFSQRYVVIKQDNGIQLRMRLIMPGMPKDIEDFKLYIDGHTTLHVSFEDLVAADSSSILNAMRFTKTMLYSIFGTRTDQNEPILPLLFLPDEQAKMDLLMSDHLTYDATKIFSTSVAFEDLGLIRDPAGVPYIFLDRTEMTLSDEQSGGHDKATKPMIKASRFPKRRDFLHPVSTYDQPRKNDGVLLDPDLCSIESLPLRYARFGTFIPSIQRQIRNSLLVERLNSTILTSARMSSMKLIMEAISSPAAHEASNYQRMEFLGDAVLKYYTAVTLMAQNLNYPEGYLANTKDLIVSNKSAALAAKEVGLDEFIIRTGFTAAKWRPIYMREIESVAPNIHKDDTAELSTKVLADVVEALIGAAYLDGGDTEAKVLAMLDIFTCAGVRSEISWRPLAQMQQTLISAAPELKQLPSMVTHLQTMTGYTFKHPTLAVEALTHPNHISLSSGVATGTTSYQRLEFLGDAVLDMLVTRAIYSFKKSTSVFRMHLLRTAAVNQDILGYFALCLSTDLDTSELVNNKALLSRKRNKYSNMRDKPNKLPQKTVRSITLPQLLRHAPTPQLSLDLINMQKRCSELGDDLRNALETGIEYPWKLLASLAPEKLASDLIESVTGAIYIDSLGNLDACEAWIERVGILAWLRRALEEDVKVWHPKEELGVLAGTQKVKYLSSRQDEKDQTFVCTVIVGEKEICQAQGASKKIAETNAAATAIEILSRGEGYKVSRHPAMMDSEREEGDIELDI